MASESSGFTMARERLTHDMLNKPISAYRGFRQRSITPGGASRSPTTVRFEALRASQLSAPFPVSPTGGMKRQNYGNSLR
jgi:hypothetical protein